MNAVRVNRPLSDTCEWTLCVRSVHFRFRSVGFAIQNVMSARYMSMDSHLGKNSGVASSSMALLLINDMTSLFSETFPQVVMRESK